MSKQSGWRRCRKGWERHLPLDRQQPVVSSKALMFIIRREHLLAHEGELKTRQSVEACWWHPALKAMVDDFMENWW